MKLATQVATVQSNTTFGDTVKMSIDAASASHVMKMMTDIYSDPYTATAREYISNAIDALISASGATSFFGTVLPHPVEVTLPSRLNPTFTIRDKGTGMSRDILMNVYPKYGASTKRDTNSEIGGFGLGAKAAFSVATSFIVTSVKAGKKNTVIFEKGADGVGEGKFLDEQDTVDGNGTVVSITLPDPDRLVRVFADPQLLLGFPKGSIVVNGKPHENSVYDESRFTQFGEAGWMLNSVVDWETASKARLSKSHNEKIVLVGPVAYRFNRNQLDNLNYGSSYGQLDDFSVVNLPIGSVDMTPSRDTLVFTDRTRRAIVEGTKALNAEVIKFVQERVASVKTRTEAVNVAHSLHQAGFGKDWEFKGEKIPSKQILPVKDKDNFLSGESKAKTRVQPFTYATQADHDFVVVHGVMGKEHAQELNRFRKAFESEHDGGLSSNFRLYFTTASFEELDAMWIPAMVGTVMTVDEFETKGAEYRKVLNAQRRAQRLTKAGADGVDANAVMAAALAVPVSLLFMNQAGSAERPGSTRVSASTVTAVPNVIYIHPNDMGTVSVMSRVFGLQTGSRGTLQNDMVALNNIMNIISTHMDGDVSFVRIPANTKIETFVRAVPHAVNIDTAFNSVVDAYRAANKVTVAQVAFMRAASSRNVEWLNAFNTVSSREKIESDEVRTWLADGSSLADGIRYSNSLVRVFNTFSQHYLVKAHFTEFEAAVQEYKHYEFPLLDGYRSHNLPVSEAVEYINYKSAKN